MLLDILTIISSLVFMNKQQAKEGLQRSRTKSLINAVPYINFNVMFSTH